MVGILCERPVGMHEYLARVISNKRSSQVFLRMLRWRNNVRNNSVRATGSILYYQNTRIQRENEKYSSHV